MVLAVRRAIMALRYLVILLQGGKRTRRGRGATAAGASAAGAGDFPDLTDAAGASVAAAIAAAALQAADAAALAPSDYVMTADQVRQLHHQARGRLSFVASRRD